MAANGDHRRDDGGGDDGHDPAAAGLQQPQHLQHALSLPSIDELDVGRLHALLPGLLAGSGGSGSGSTAASNLATNAATWSARSTPTASPAWSSSAAGRRRRRHHRRALSAGGPPPVGGGVGRRVSRVTTQTASPTSSVHSSAAGAAGTVDPLTVAASLLPGTPLLQNMMRSHHNRDPYRDYLVLGLIGKGSIGSVEKVVRRHHSVVPHGVDGKKGGGWCGGGGIFGSCCAPAKEEQHDDKPCWGLFAKFFSNAPTKNDDAFQSTRTTDSQSDSGKSVVSESSAFSAPPSPTASLVSPTVKQIGIDGARRSTSQRDDGTMDAASALSYHTVGPSSIHTYADMHHRRRSHGRPHPLRKYALKSIRLDRAHPGSRGISSGDEAELRNEISILRSLDHPNIVHIVETYEYRNQIYMVIDLCENGDLYVMDPYGEGEAKIVMRQLLRAVSYMHHRGIVHRDLKYENVMFSDRGSGRSKLEIKLIDFGLSKKYGRARGKLDMSASMTDFVGTIYTMAPEVIRGDYTYKCDCWSLGVMAYMLLSSQLPFCGKSMKEIARKIMFSDHSFSGKRWSKISRRGREFVSSLLVRDVDARPTADTALKHPWLAGGRPSFHSGSLHRRHSSETVGGSVFSLLQTPPQTPLDSQICASIENYSTYSWMHRLALMVIAYRYTGEETTHLRRIYLSYDVDNSGTVDVDEFRDAFALHDKYTKEEIDEIFLAVDMNGSGKISWTEFLAATIETKGPISEEEFSSAFDHLDFDKNGFISTSDLREVIGRDLPQSVIDQIIDESDIIGDHRIWKDEFLALADESTMTHDEYRQRRQVHVYLKRSRSADDFDLVKTRSLEIVYPDDEKEEDEDTGSDQFRAAKAKSVRKVTQFA